jgi:hypothetical protein
MVRKLMILLLALLMTGGSIFNTSIHGHFFHNSGDDGQLGPGPASGPTTISTDRTYDGADGRSGTAEQRRYLDQGLVLPPMVMAAEIVGQGAWQFLAWIFPRRIPAATRGHSLLRNGRFPSYHEPFKHLQTVFLQI